MPINLWKPDVEYKDIEQLLLRTCECFNRVMLDGDTETKGFQEKAQHLRSVNVVVNYESGTPFGGWGHRAKSFCILGENGYCRQTVMFF